MSSIMALDIGSRRIGVALADTRAKLPRPLETLINDDNITNRLLELCRQQEVERIIVGLPRGLDGQETKQTLEVRNFGAKLGSELGLPLTWQDEAVTSKKAKAELESRGKPYQKSDIDALAATYILEDYFGQI